MYSTRSETSSHVIQFFLPSQDSSGMNHGMIPFQGPCLMMGYNLCFHAAVVKTPGRI